MASPKFVGRDVVLNYAIGKEDADPLLLSFVRLGAVRTKDTKAKWDTSDVTADTSPAYTKENLVTFKSVTFSCAGISYGEAVANQKALKAQAVSPGSTTDNQPKVWLQIIDPDGDMWQGPFIVSDWSDGRPYDQGASFSFEAMSNGDVAYTPA